MVNCVVGAPGSRGEGKGAAAVSNSSSPSMMMEILFTHR